MMKFTVLGNIEKSRKHIDSSYLQAYYALIVNSQRDKLILGGVCNLIYEFSEKRQKYWVG